MYQPSLDTIGPDDDDDNGSGDNGPYDDDGQETQESSETSRESVKPSVDAICMAPESG